MGVRHLVFTRFNTQIDFAPTPKRLEMDWLMNRLSLFERYCLPSVAGQVNVMFHWLVFLDAASPQWFKERVESYRPLVNPVYIDGPATDQVIRRSIAVTGLVSSSHLITRRLDNDDSLANTHLSLVQRVFKKQEREFIVFPLGLISTALTLPQILSYH